MELPLYRYGRHIPTGGLMPLGRSASALAEHIPARGDWCSHGRSLSLLQSPPGTEGAILGDSGRCDGERVVIGLETLNVNRLATTEATIRTWSDRLDDVIDGRRLFDDTVGTLVFSLKFT